ncbi:Uncharacterised protein [Acinetobacter baumannii]|uniref:hypothetical protein n=1 Tax=Acinetobacter baumannii TaxID=470 RepID=UPI00068D88FC|nr:hypothetical protein [Acinetobacter baumannii]KAB1612394.1 hypothetical protein F8B12_01435 [Acinetobacter baumannii]MCG9255625.1 hypothetical protein [Acinetobacter baumannii]MCG9261512.1 hypothetical protein [Acinetobacter baumannii]MDV7653847.1 hypothetical protein [Acinetobacter baumannii]SSR19254.1 Uncharacterised protein [Acinetobacter baumannii]
MIDLNKKREAFERFHAKECNCSYESLKRQLDRQEALTGHRYLPTSPRHEAWLIWDAAWQEKAKAQAVPTWIPTSTMLPDEGEEVLFLDSHNVIHEGSLNTDYVDGPYGENNEDHGDYQTLWTSNSNGEEFLLEEIKFWMARPSDPITCGSGAANE